MKYRVVINEKMDGSNAYEIYVIDEEAETVLFILGPYLTEAEAQTDVNNIIQELEEKQLISSKKTAIM